MDMVTGARVAVALPVPIPRQRMWDLVTAVGRIGEWSPEATGGSWCDDAQGPAPGARFIGRNRFPNGFESTVTLRGHRSGAGTPPGPPAPPTARRACGTSASGFSCREARDRPP